MLSQNFEESLQDLGRTLPHGDGINYDGCSQITRSSVGLINAFQCIDAEN